jgi:peptidoglycan hydrolase-like protein with peptidoglycan-binding domain
VRDLQRDLRALGYLKRGIDGVFGASTTRAVQGLQYDLLWNQGKSSSGDASAPVAVADYNRSRVAAVTGVADQATVACMAEMLDDAAFPKLPFSSNSAAENAKILAQVAALPSTTVPIPFLLGILNQESGLKHFCEPSNPDEDSFVVVGTDTNASQPYIVTSRGYGVGQYTLFHHPPCAEEVASIMLDPAGNIQRATKELREKFDGFVNGPTPGGKADDRQAERGAGPLLVCKYAPADAKYMKDCKSCLRDAGLVQIHQGDPVFAGSSLSLQPTQYYPSTSYTGVPERRNIPCDWPYAVRRYNGSGVNSYHYQIHVLLQVLNFNVPQAANEGAAGAFQP